MRNRHKSVMAALTLAAVIAANGCTKRVDLTPEAPSKFTPDVSLTTPTAFRAAVEYMNMNLRQEYFGDSCPMITESLFSDVAVDGTTDKTTNAQDLNVRITPTAQLNNDDYNKIGKYWEMWWKAVHYANSVVSRIDNATWASPADRNVVLGDAYFHRAYAYYRLTNEFGDVPLILKEETQVNVSYFSTQRAVILKQMKADMELAVTYLNDNVDKGEVTRGAAYHLLTKIDLSLGLFDDAITAANAVINGSKYKMMTARFGVVATDATKNIIWDLHRPENKSAAANTEALFNIIDRETLDGATNLGSQVMRNCVPMWHNGTILTPTNKKSGITDAVTAEFPLTLYYGRGIGRYRGTPYATKYIWTDNTDLRHAPGNWVNMTDLVYNNAAIKSTDPTWYGQHLQQYTAATVNQVFVNGPRDTIRAWFGWPHYKVFIGSGPLAIDKWWSPPRGTNTDWYIYRLAETYLLRAEAYVWKGQTALAMADLNVVRARAQAALLTDASKVTMSTVLDERARELYFEEPRHAELARIAFIYAQTGIPAYNGKSYNTATFSTNNFFFDRVIEKNDFYNKGVVTNSGNTYTISPYHVLWPIPDSDIKLNINGHINQNKGYSGSETNIAPLDHVVN